MNSDHNRLRCRFCAADSLHTFVDLGMSPLCESYVRKDQLDQMEPFYPLHAYICEECLLVQLLHAVQPESIFSDYAYFSSYSDSWLEHARNYTVQMIERLGLTETSRVIEIASNDGYLLQYFLERKIPVLGIEPARNVAATATNKGIPTLVRFFGTEVARELAEQGQTADLLLGNNVLAHVPDLNGFVEGMRILLRPEGTITMEFPYIRRLIEGNQFDTIYHEHFSYFSLTTVERVFRTHSLRIWDVEEIDTHGGSLRIYACHAGHVASPETDRLARLRDAEHNAGYGRLDGYLNFTKQVESTKRKLLDCLIREKANGRSIVGYGAPGKGNTLLNYCGIRTDFLDYTVDRNPYKQGLFLPGTHIPILPPSRIAETRPDLILILPWNLKQEILGQLAYVRQWGGRFIVPIPEVEVCP